MYSLVKVIERPDLDTYGYLRGMLICSDLWFNCVMVLVSESVVDVFDEIASAVEDRIDDENQS